MSVLDRCPRCNGFENIDGEESCGWSFLYNVFKQEHEALKEKCQRMKLALEYYAALQKCSGYECCGNCGDSYRAEEALE